MNSKVKQAQKEGASVSDISAGLAYSVIKNALFKVIKVSDASELGKQIVVQGGTFYNDARFCRSFEKIAAAKPSSPVIAGIMGLRRCPDCKRTLQRKAARPVCFPMKKSALCNMKPVWQSAGLISTSCRLTINKFSGGRQFISGNRCERGIGGQKNANHVPNLFEYKLHRLFSYPSLDADKAPRGTVGIPRVLNMYEDYPFWHTFFTKLGYRVILSPSSNRKI